MNDPDKIFAPKADAFRCGETSDEDGNPVFHCKLMTSLTEDFAFTFTTRERSIGVLLDGETATTQEEDQPIAGEEEDVMDPFFFDPGYTLAATTGFQIWAGTRMLVDCVMSPPLVAVNPGDVVIELGAGVGVVGTCWAASTGAHVILTDLATLVQNAVIPNLRANSRSLQDSEPHSTAYEEDNEARWVPICQGQILPLALDWTKDIPERLQQQTRLDWIIASDCVWLRTMLLSLLDTVQRLFTLHPNAAFLLSFQKRGNPSDDTMFTTPSSVYKEMIDRNWNVERLAWRPVNLSDGKQSEVYLWKVSLGR